MRTRFVIVAARRAVQVPGIVSEKLEQPLKRNVGDGNIGPALLNAMLKRPPLRYLMFPSRSLAWSLHSSRGIAKPSQKSRRRKVSYSSDGTKPLADLDHFILKILFLATIQEKLALEKIEKHQAIEQH